MRQQAPSALQPSDMTLIYEYLLRRSVQEPNTLRSVILLYEQNARSSIFLARYAVHMLGSLIKPHVEKVRYFIFGTKYADLILSLPKEEVCVIGGLKQLIFCMRNNLAFLPGPYIWDELICGLRESGAAKNIGSLQGEIGKVAHRIRRHAANNALLIVENDSLPLQRAIIMTGRQAGIKQCVCIQHGVFQKNSPAHIMDGWFADLFFVFSAHQKDMLVEKGMEPTKIEVMGFHSAPYSPTRPASPPGRRLVCFLGQHWFISSDERGRRYVDIVLQLQGLLADAGINMFYKPHPGEAGAKYLTKLTNLVDIPLHTAFESFDVFISLTSTALLEAAWSGRAAIQIVDDAFDADRMEEFDHVTSLDWNAPSLIEKLVELIQYASANEPARAKRPGERFIECLEARQERAS